MTTDALDRAIRRAALDRATWETFASDAKRRLLVEAFLLACDDRTLLAGECERLRAVEDAARAVVIERRIGSGDRYRQCGHCGAMSLYADMAIDHHDGCAGVRLRDALTATTRGEGDES